MRVERPLFPLRKRLLGLEVLFPHCAQGARFNSCVLAPLTADITIHQPDPFAFNLFVDACLGFCHLLPASVLLLLYGWPHQWIVTANTTPWRPGFHCLPPCRLSAIIVSPLPQPFIRRGNAG